LPIGGHHRVAPTVSGARVAEGDERDRLYDAGQDHAWFCGISTQNVTPDSSRGPERICLDPSRRLPDWPGDLGAELGALPTNLARRKVVQRLLGVFERLLGDLRSCSA
jgi:hypothetical protein